jgi:hypothetical protein
MTKRKQRLRDVYESCMREFYANSIGFDGQAGDYDKLKENPIKDEQGNDTIPFEDYYLDRDVFDEIMNRHLKTKGLSPFDKSTLRFHLHLGVSPNSSKERWEERRQAALNK